MKKLYLALVASLVGSIASAQYCTPTCTMASSGCMYGRINLFQVNGASGTVLIDSAGCTGSGYEDRHLDSMMTCTLNPGGTYSMVLTNSGSPFYSQVWIDYNDDYSFDSSEILSGANGWMRTTTLSFTVPSGASTGYHRMRLVNEYGSTTYRYPAMRPCMGSTYSMADARDYTVYVGSSSSGCGTLVGGTASASASSYCATHNLSLSDAGCSTGSGISYMWEQSTDGGTTWTAVSGGGSMSATIAEPSVNTMYRCTLTCGSSSASSTTVSYTAPNRVWGNISFSSAAPDTVSLKVWLIAHDTTAGTLTAVDSMITSCVDSMSGAYYEFNGASAGYYLVKAKSLDVTSSTAGASGYIPTYGYNSPYWGGATHIAHTSGVNNQNIDMAYGTVTSGPGFIGGLISAGAGRGTSGDVPAPNVLVYLKNTTSGIITHTYTDNTGAYSFPSIANGAYIIYPEVMGFATIPSSTITLSASSETATGVNFKQYNTTKIVRPIVAGVANINSNEFSIAPNPASYVLNINWANTVNEAASLIITDVTGRVVVNSVIDMTSGTTSVSLNGLNEGVYIVNINSNTANFSEKLVVKH